MNELINWHWCSKAVRGPDSIVTWGPIPSPNLSYSLSFLHYPPFLFFFFPLVSPTLEVCPLIPAKGFVECYELLSGICFILALNYNNNNTKINNAHI